MNIYLKEPIEKYLKDLSARKIVPGGGSAAALSAAIGAALNLMVINYTFKEKGSVADNDMLMVAEAQQEETLRRLSSLIDEDCAVFKKLMRAISSKEKNIQEKYIAAAKIPMDICRECHVSMGITAFLSKSGNRGLVTDVGCAMRLLRAAFDSARLNAEINLKMIKDRSFTRDKRKMLRELANEFENAEKEITMSVEKIMRGREK